MFSIINTKGKTARQHPVKCEVQRMNAAETGETLDIGQQRIDTIHTDTRFLRLVEISRRLDVFGGVCKNDNLLQRPRRSFSWATVRN
jgi:hypothetical protein